MAMLVWAILSWFTRKIPVLDLLELVRYGWVLACLEQIPYSANLLPLVTRHQVS